MNGESAYTSFSRYNKWRSITNYPLPSWKDLDPFKKGMWNEIAKDVIKDYEESKLSSKVSENSSGDSSSD